MTHPPPYPGRAAPKLISVVMPLFNEEEIIPELQKRIEHVKSLIGCASNWIMVDDGSSDRTGELLEAWARQDQSIKVLRFARNFGHQAAITAGLDKSIGDAVVVMDGDLQDPPELIVQMLEKYRQGYDVVYARRKTRE